MPETKILGPPTLPPPKRLAEGRETQDLAGGKQGEKRSPPDSPLFSVEKERGAKETGFGDAIAQKIAGIICNNDNECKHCYI
jgi:hypothetical protein